MSSLIRLVLSFLIYLLNCLERELKNPDYFYTWLTRITINTSINHIKKHSKIIPMELGTEPRDIELIQTDQETTIDLYNAIDKLDEKLKTVIILKYLEDMTLSEVSAWHFSLFF